MEFDCIRHREIPHTTRLFTAFSEEFSKVAEFYAHTPDASGVRAAAQDVQLDSAVRRAVAEILREQNRALASGHATARNIERLAQGAVAIVTGQQVGLFGGPAFGVYKALSALNWAETLSRAGVEAVPIFWMATEDHDLAEVNHIFFDGRQGLAKIELPAHEQFEGRSVGRIPLGQTIGAAVEHAAQCLVGANARAISGALADSYRDGETYGTAFGKLMARLFGSRGLILLDPLDHRLHELARPIYRKAAQESRALAEELLARSKLLDRRGFHAQVKITSQTTLLFLEIGGKRQAVRRRNGDLWAGEKKLSQPEFLSEIDQRPERISPGVLLRPIVQDALLPTAAYVGGPAEVAYMAQAQVVYTRILGRMPAILPRPSLTLIEPDAQRLLRKYHLEFHDLLRGRQHVRRRMERQCVPRALASRFARDEKSLRKLLRGYRKPLSRLDPTLAGALTTAERKMLHQFEKLREKAGRAGNFRNGVLDRHEALLLSTLFPHHGLQERALSFLPFLARHGYELLDELSAAMRKSCPGHMLIQL
jgi:bacillithiol biosynthesis cysteine-adding enzyme BshC